MLGHRSKVGFLHHLVESFSAKSVEEPDPLEVDDGLWNFVNKPSLFPLVIIFKIDHHYWIIFFK